MKATIKSLSLIDLLLIWLGLFDDPRLSNSNDHANESVRAHYTRPRAVPATFARMWADESSELHSEPWPDFARDRRWTPKDSALRERGLGWRERASTP